jgi:hypothetical protein
MYTCPVFDDAEVLIHFVHTSFSFQLPAVHMLAFQYRAAVASALSLIVAVLFIVSLTLSWFAITSQVVYQDLVRVASANTVLNATIADYFTDRIVVTRQPTRSPRVVSTQFLDELPLSAVIQTLRLSQSFAICSAIIALANSAYLLSLSATKPLYSCSRFCGRGTLKGYLIFCSLLLFITAILSVLLFLNFPASLSKDNSACRAGACVKFAGSTSNSLEFVYAKGSDLPVGEVVQKDEFGPGAGWIIAAVATPISLLLLIAFCCCNFPYVTVFDDPDDPDGARVSNLKPSFAVL